MSASLALFCAAAFVLIVTPDPNFFCVLTRPARLRWMTGASFIGLGVWAALPDRR